MSITEEIYGMYREMGICSEVLEYGMRAEKKLAERFENIDRIAEYNQLKVLNAMQKNHVSESHFGASTGYGYTDAGRDTPFFRCEAV